MVSFVCNVNFRKYALSTAFGKFKFENYLLHILIRILFGKITKVLMDALNVYLQEKGNLIGLKSFVKNMSFVI